MPSPHHEQLVELFRNQGELAPALLELCADIVVAHERVELGSIDLSQAVPTEYRADVVVLLHDRDGRTAAVIVEVQLAEDARKPWTWPLYVAALRARHECPVYLLVIAPSARVARWARATLSLGHPRFELTPLVVDYACVPRSIDAQLARRLPELAVLAALAHPDPETAKRALAALQEVPDELARLYCDLVGQAIAPAQRQPMEDSMTTEAEYHVSDETFYRWFPQKRIQRLLLKVAHAKVALTAQDERRVWAFPIRIAEELVVALSAASSADEARRAFDAALAAAAAIAHK